jgi:hypothetical protein
MDDDFGFGGPITVKAAAPAPSDAVAPALAPSRPRLSLGGPVLLVIAGMVAIALVVGVMAVMKSGGDAAASSAGSAIEQVNHAEDVQATVTLQQVQAEAMQLFAEGTQNGPSYLAADPAGLTAIDRQYTYTASASTGPTVVSVAATDTEWAAAVLSRSGTCLWIHLSGISVSKGAGDTCTGQAAMAA